MDYIIQMYEVYFDKFITVSSFAEWYWLDDEDAQIIIDMWRKYRDRRADRLKLNVR